ncbi:DUF4384 domain-containing protein [Bradyrhizobium sp. STM 3557]|uniref:DUF4384 domain-containing protein n=1 Tax=Bradyrhizobium sp. STM 3557 TaxID=578920 RepID=UPI00388F76BE
MSKLSGIIRGFCIAAAVSLTSQALAAVVILDGAGPPPSPAPALTAPETPPDATTPQGSGPAVPAPPAELAPAAPPAITAPPPQPASPPPEARTTTLDLSGAAPANPAELSVEMLPGRTVSVGSTVSFKVSSKKPGYLVLIDVDATGHLTQLYPNTTSLTRTNRANANYVKPGIPFTIPLATDPYAGVRYVVSPPNGRATIVGILSPLPVQILDLPDVPAELVDKPDKVLSFLSKRAGELRILDSGNQLREARWSFDAKPYVIQ